MRKYRKKGRFGRSSTGPRTVSGKVRSSGNAVTHGLTSSQLDIARIEAHIRAVEEHFCGRAPRYLALLFAQAQERVVRIYAAGTASASDGLTSHKGSNNVSGGQDGVSRHGRRGRNLCDRYLAEALSARRKALAEICIHLKQVEEFEGDTP